MGKEGDIRKLSLLHGDDGLSIFLMSDLNPDEVAHINEDNDTIVLASQVTVQDTSELKGKSNAIVPELVSYFCWKLY